MLPKAFLPKALQAAKDGGHIWPAYAACEAALESAWGESGLAAHNNLFGQKMPTAIELPYPIVDFPTKEFFQDQWVTVHAHWLAFPDWATSFKERMALLHRLPVYKEALLSTYGEQFVVEVSKYWSTDPNRGRKVLSIYNAHQDSLLSA